MGIFLTFTMLVLIALLGAIYFYNKIIKLKVHVKEGWSDIQIQLKRRHNLVENLVNTVKGYAKHEAQTLEKVIQARSTAQQSEGKDMAAVQTAERGLTTALQGLNINALAEAYPDLKANTGFQQLQAELSDIENKIAASRRFYNSTVTSLNTIIQQFPGSLFAGMAGATKAEFFELDEDQAAQISETPKVNFEDKKAEAPAPAPAEPAKEEAPAPAPETAPATEEKPAEAAPEAEPAQEEAPAAESAQEETPTAEPAKEEASATEEKPAEPAKEEAPAAEEKPAEPAPEAEPAKEETPAAEAPAEEKKEEGSDQAA